MRTFPALASTVAGLIAGLVGVSVAGAATPVPQCSLFAATTGHDDAPGTRSAPFGTAQQLVDSLSPGQTGCLRGGVHTGGATISRPQITLTAAPGEQATLEGRVWVRHGADRVAVVDLRLDGVNAQRLPSPTIDGDLDTFAGDDVTDEHTAICFNIGSDAGWGRATGTTIRDSRVHGCGAPGTNLQHGIYVVAADDTLIADDTIYDNADRGIQLYPDAQRTIVRGNVIDGNGEGILFSGAAGSASSDNLVEGNVISNSTRRSNVESWYPPGAPVGTGNVVRGNCIGSAAGGAQDVAQGGVVMAENVFADPQYSDRAAGDFALATTSPCRIAPEPAWTLPAPAPTGAGLRLSSGPSGPSAPATEPARPLPAPGAGRAAARPARHIIARSGRSAASRARRRARVSRAACHRRHVPARRCRAAHAHPRVRTAR